MKTKSVDTLSTGMNWVCTCIDQYLIEPHNTGFALYYGRCKHRHGFKLCSLSDFDHKGKQTRQLIVHALNVYFGT